MSDQSTSYAFQAEVQQLLDIVINSLYTDKDIFVRELVSNASDALEKMRRLQLTEKNFFDSDLPLEINITTDDTANTFTIADYGIGMTRDEIVQNIGTIAHSGSKQFLRAMSESEQKESNLIGQFGVGFYSAFMVAEDVKVYSRSWQPEAGEHLCWTSDGKTGYEIEEAPGQRRGCKIVVQLKKEFEEFAKDYRIKSILETYSSFVPFPVNLNGERVNKIEAVWLKNKSEVSDEDYTEFYKFIAHAHDEPAFRMHFSADAPLSINALVFTPKENPEKMLSGPVDPGVSLYCKKVLIAEQPKGLLPEWLRFLKGVIDSADLPLNISRESMQDSALVQKINRLITKRFLKSLEGEAKSDEAKYDEFYSKFNRFIKEGIAMDFDHRDALAKLLRFESTFTEPGKLTGLQGYIDRAKDDQKQIYYIIGPSRESIEAGPYLEAFTARGLEVIFFYDAIDDYVVNALAKFEEKDLVSIDRDDISLDDAATPEGEALDEATSTSLCDSIKNQLGDRVKEVRMGERLVDSPAIALTPDDGMNAQVRQMMKQMNQDVGVTKVILELNPRHEVVKKLAAAYSAKPELAELVTAQIFDNALLSAGLLEESKDMVKRVYDIIDQAL
ncbi:molecular chaperone HtpG [Verrucomicrobiales bacterium]|jgi:molecular chaperone HtpG|nr:molecular chaperone HtpG [Verrucomicrobiales bacterium]MDC0503676.1 molecular chaperone HtpG [Verrucomicrobiales bacterium]MDF1789285.1 molecular chaperone HtpG [Verrucomicrobiales bacterium]